jgi:plastocyanin
MAPGDHAMKRFLPALAASAILAGGAQAEALAATIEVRATAVDGSPLADAVVAAYPLDGAALPEKSPGRMDQKDRRFTPQVLAVQRGSDVVFPNSDTVSHHVYSFSPANRFEIFLARGDAPKSVHFDRPGIVTLGCNLHDWMLGYVAVVDTPYFAVSGADGEVTLEELPPGAYRVEVWHPRATDERGALERRAELATTDATELWELRLARPLLPARDQAPGLTGY